MKGGEQKHLKHVKSKNYNYEKEKSYEKISSAILLFVFIISMCLPCFASSNDSIVISEDSAPVIGSFIIDSEYAALITAREQESFSVFRLITAQRAASTHLLNISQYPQETSNWCGYASLRSVGMYKGIVRTQTEIKNWVVTLAMTVPCHGT